MKKSLREHWRMTKYSNECDFVDWPFLMNILDVKEVHWTIDIITIIVSVTLFINGYSFLGVAVLGTLAHLSMVSLLSVLSTIVELKWRKSKDIRDGLKLTMDRLGLYTKDGKKNASKTGFKHTN